jgi:PhoPQ-activated pathogenicity-related protein
MKPVPAIATAFLLFAPAGCRAQNAPAPSAATSPTKAPVPTALDDYIARPEPAYKWEKVATAPGAPEELKLVSQTWQGAEWTHRVQIFRPAKAIAPDTAVLQIDLGVAIPGGDMLAQMLANSTGLTLINLYSVPNQPLFGLREDALIAYTFDKYLTTGDDTWPLQLPLTKSGVKAMDAVGEYSRQQHQTPITKFIVTGASKRGWTTWLAGAMDKRVIGIMPMVYDNLNLAKQMPHQVEVWGNYSGKIDDYTKMDLQAKLQTPPGRKLAAIVDPWTYRARITMPKLLVMGTNDPYWPLDSVNLYREDLAGPVNYLYAPNAGHSLNGQEARVIGSAAAWARRVARGEKLPSVELRPGAQQADGSRAFSIASDAANARARLWVAHSKTRDFRQARWTPREETQVDKAGVYQVQTLAPPADTAYSAAIGEVEIKEPGLLLPLIVSTPVVVWKNDGPTGVAH